MEPQTVIFLGPQGSGKGTQVKLFKQFLAARDPKRTIVHLDMGATIRKFYETSGYTWDRIRASMARGEFQPAFVTCYLMAHTFIAEMGSDEHLIVDGFPREPKQAAIFDTAIAWYERPNPTILNIIISEEESLKRLLARGRNDDTEESIRERLRWSREQVSPMVDAYRGNAGYRVVDVDGAGTVEEVGGRILQALGLEK